jgi:hypothetical protein
MDWLESDHMATPQATIAEACFLCFGSVQSGYKGGEFRSWQFRVRVRRRRSKFRESAVERIRLCQEDFTCTVVQ